MYEIIKVKPVKVEVSQGVVVGEQRPLPNGQHFNSFQGIPYAVPPLGELRYRVRTQLVLYLYYFY